MNTEMKTYVLWTATGKEARLKDVLEKTILQYIPSTTLYIPQKKRLFQDKNGWSEIKEVLFPGYVFLDTPDIDAVHADLYDPQIATEYKLLGMKEQDVMTVTDEERAWIQHMCNEEGWNAGVSKGVKEGGKVTFTSGPLVGMEGFISKLNRHKRQAELHMEFFGAMRKITLACEIENMV